MANKTKSLFLANMSHEIRTPLASIIGFTDLALDSADQGQIVDFLHRIRRNSDHLLQLINDILDVSKVEAGLLPITQSSFDWREMIFDTFDALAPQFKAKSLAVDFQCESQMPIFLLSDAHRMRQILINLLGNAIKFTESGSVQVVAHLSSDTSVNRLLIDITDTGPGISAKEQLQLFQPFEQVNMSLARRHGGTGLGLHLSKKLAQLLGGDLILLNSEVGVGSTFRLSLPARFDLFGKANGGNTRHEKQAVPEPSRPIKVLLVEDTLENQIIITAYLKQTKFEVEYASDGLEALRKVQDGHFDLILMDIQMPRMDGREATRQLRKMGYRRPIVALTARATLEEQAIASESGFSEYLTKPIQKTALIATIKQLVALEDRKPDVRPVDRDHQ